MGDIPMENDPLISGRRARLAVSLPMAAFLVLVSVFPSVAANIRKEKKKLEKIQSRIQQLEEDLKKYKSRSSQIRKEMESLKKKEKGILYEIRRLERKIRRTRKNKSATEKKYNRLKHAYYGWKDALKEEMLLYFKSRLSDSPYFGRDDIARKIFLKSVIREKFTLIRKAEKDSRNIKTRIRKLDMEKRSLERKKRSAQRKRSAYKKVVKKKSGELSAVEREKKRISGMVAKLREDAKSLNWLIRKLEKQSPYRKKSSYEPPLVRNSLPWPADGRVVSRFGRERIEKLKTWIIREGIKIETSGHAPVFPVRGGEVIYAGKFRSYGKVVIIKHGAKFSSIYGMLSAINVKTGETVNANTVIGRAGEDTRDIYERKNRSGKSVLYFEIRFGSEARDPLLWLRRR